MPQSFMILVFTASRVGWNLPHVQCCSVADDNSGSEGGISARKISVHTYIHKTLIVAFDYFVS